MFLVYRGSQDDEKMRKIKVMFIMVQSGFAKNFKFNRIAKYCMVIYAAALILAIPGGICSVQSQLPDFELLVAAPDATSSGFNIDSDTHLCISAGPAEIFEQNEAAGSDLDRVIDQASHRYPFYDDIVKAAREYQVDAALIQAIIKAESNNNPKAVSHRGAEGLMQLMPTTAKSLGVSDTFDPALNIDGGVRYFKKLLDRFDGDVRLALAAYNAGSRYVRKYGGVPPFRATRAYIKKVLHYHRQLQEARLTNDSGLTTS